VQVQILCSIRPRMQHSKGNGTHTEGGKKGKFFTLLNTLRTGDADLRF